LDEKSSTLHREAQATPRIVVIAGCTPVEARAVGHISSPHPGWINRNCQGLVMSETDEIIIQKGDKTFRIPNAIIERFRTCM
jgi:hypothetical protein